MNGKELVIWEPGITEEWTEYARREDGIVARKFVLSKGWLVVVIKQIYNYKLAVSKYSPRFYDDWWCYEDIMSVSLAFILWNPIWMEEPYGWIRHPRTGRRRAYDENGLLEKEWLNW